MKKTKHVIVIVAMAVMLALEAGLVTYGFEKIEEEYIDNYLKQQEQYIVQLNLHMEYMLEQGADKQSLVSYMAESVPVSGSYYAWLTRDESVIFAKNETITETLGEAEAWPVFKETICDKENCNVSAEFSYNGVEYITGMVIDRSYILNHKNLQQFKVYGAVSLSVLGMVTFSVLIVYIQRFCREKKKNILIAEELRNKNSVLDEVYEDVQDLNQKIRTQEQNRKKSYDLQMAKKLLEKSERADIQPVYYAAVQLQMDEGQYYRKQQIIDIMNKISLDQRHVRMEIQKGCFLIMFYRTEPDAVEKILKKAQEEWRSMGVELRIRAGGIAADTPDRKWLDEFLKEREGNT